MNVADALQTQACVRCWKEMTNKRWSKVMVDNFLGRFNPQYLKRVGQIFEPIRPPIFQQICKKLSRTLKCYISLWYLNLVTPHPDSQNLSLQALKDLDNCCEFNLNFGILSTDTRYIHYGHNVLFDEDSDIVASGKQFIQLIYKMYLNVSWC